MATASFCFEKPKLSILKLTKSIRDIIFEDNKRNKRKIIIQLAIKFTFFPARCKKKENPWRIQSSYYYWDTKGVIDNMNCKKHATGLLFGICFSHSQYNNNCSCKRGQSTHALTPKQAALWKSKCDCKFLVYQDEGVFHFNLLLAAFYIHYGQGVKWELGTCWFWMPVLSWLHYQRINIQNLY